MPAYGLWPKRRGFTSAMALMYTVRRGMMKVEFRTNRLWRNYRNSARAIREWGPDVARTFVLRINMLAELKDFQAAYRVQAFHLHPLHGSRAGAFSIYLVGRWRLIVTKGDSDETVIIEEVSNHYDD